jgi:hypothetical protein
MPDRPRSQIEVHLDACESEADVFQALVDQIGLADLYGRTWFGMQQNFFYDPNAVIPDTLVVHGHSSLLRVVPNAVDELEKCFQVHRDGEPTFTVRYVDDV